MDDTELKALLAEGAPPARDLRFELAVMARIERRAISNLAIAALLLAATYVWTRFYAGQD